MASTDTTSTQESYLETIKVEESTAKKTEANAAQNVVNKDMQKTDVFYLDVKVFLEGVQVPHSSCSVSYGIDSPPSASIVIPASAYLRDLPATTKLTVIYKDLLPDSKGEYKYRMLFDGEIDSLSYSINATGAFISISAVHSTAYLTLMQLLTQAASQYLYDNSATLLGNMTMISGPAGYSKIKANIVNKVIEGKAYSSMADIVYILLRNMLEGYKDIDGAAVAKWYWWRLGNDPGGYKILQRIYGVSDKAKSAPILDGLELRGYKEELGTEELTQERQRLTGQGTVATNNIHPQRGTIGNNGGLPVMKGDDGTYLRADGGHYDYSSIPRYGVANEHLTANGGHFDTYYGYETYYNLKMDGCVYYMRNQGFTGPDWEVGVREDGVKTFGGFVMCAVDTYKTPKGTIIETSMGTAIVVDHCQSSEKHPGQVDIAVTWKNTGVKK